jgi:spermidine synthase
MTDWFTEKSESDTRTSYPLTRRLFEGATATCDSVVIAESPVFGRMLFLDGELQSASVDEHVYHESLVHPVMTLTRPEVRVLVVGGGEGATVREVLRWSPAHVTWVDIDLELVNLCRQHLDWAPGVYTDPRVIYYADDIRTVLPKLGMFDVVILDLPDPDGDTGYLYSEQFILDIHAHLELDGSIATHCGPVRPFGSVGGGFQRLLPLFGVGRFYAQMIPSFQSEWGFMIWTASSRFRQLPDGLRVVDVEQMATWAAPSLLWRTAINEAGYAFIRQYSNPGP